MRLEPEVLHKFIPLFLRDGWQVVCGGLPLALVYMLISLIQNVHGIGDRANGVVVDAFAASLKGVNVTALRPRLEHAQMINSKDIERLGGLGVIASVQPTHAYVSCYHTASGFQFPYGRCW